MEDRKIAAAIDKLIDRCNLIGDGVDIYAEMNRYKALRYLSEQQRDEIYDSVATALGFRW